jgi:hypothetical protein
MLAALRECETLTAAEAGELLAERAELAAPDRSARLLLDGLVERGLAERHSRNRYPTRWTAVD